jgi:hypothetical protein
MPSQTEVAPAAHESLMSQEELNGLLASVGNHEAKASALLLMQPGAFYSGPRLSSMLAEQQAKKFGAFPSHKTIAAYCLQTFEPIGLIAKTVNTMGKMEFGLTSKGEREGKAFAGHLLDLSLRHPETSLRRIFGMTHSRDKQSRPPILRYQILLDLLTADDAMTQIEIIESTGLSDQEVRDHITEMEEDGILTTHLASRPAVYMPLENDIERETVGGTKAITEQVNQIFRNAANREDSRLTRGMVSEKIESDKDMAKVRTSVNHRIQKLNRMGLIKLESRQISNERVVWLTLNQKNIADDVCSLIEKLREGDSEFMREGIEKGMAIMGKSPDLRELIEKSAANSPQASSVPYQEKVSRIVGVLGNLGQANAEQITEVINDGRITLVSVNKSLKRMREMGVVDIAVPRQGKIAGQWELITTTEYQSED